MGSRWEPAPFEDGGEDDGAAGGEGGGGGVGAQVQEDLEVGGFAVGEGDAAVAEDGAFGGDVGDGAGVEGVVLAAEREQMAVEGEHGAGVLALGLGRFLWASRIRVGATGWRRGVVKPALGLGVQSMGERSGSRPLPFPGSRSSAGSLTWSGAMGTSTMPKLVAVVERGRAAEREQQHGGGFGLDGADAGGEAGLVVVAEDVVGPGADGQQRLVGADDVGNGFGLPRGLDQVEVEGEIGAGEVGLLAFGGAVVADELGEGEVDFADEDAVGGSRE